MSAATDAPHRRATQEQADRAVSIIAKILGPGTIALVPARAFERGWTVSLAVTRIGESPTSIVHPEEGHDVPLAWRRVQVGPKVLQLRCGDLRFSDRFLGEILAEPLRGGQ